MKLRLALAILGLASFALLHGYGALDTRASGLPTGMWLTELFEAAGCAVAAYGLARQRVWARCLGVGIGCVALTQVVGMGVWTFLHPFGDAPCAIPWGLAQGAIFVALILLLSGGKMRAAFEESPSSPWTFGSPLAGLMRATVVAGIGAIPMLCLMAATSVYATTEGPRVSALIAATAMAASLVLLLRGKTIALPLLALSSIGGGIAAARTVLSLDTNPSLVGVNWYTSMPVVAAGATLPGLFLGVAILAAFIPGMVRFLRHAQ
jgi:hypothetical protein